MTARTRRAAWVALTLAAAIGAAAYVFGVALPVRRLRAALPAVESEGMEPQVAAKLSAIREAARAESRSAAAWGRLGQVFHAHDVLPQAVSCYRQAAVLDPGDFRWPYLAALALREIDTATALPYFEQAAALQRRDAAIHIRFGEALVETGQLDRARQQYESAAAVDERSTHALYGRAQVAWLQGDLDAALGYLTRAAELEPRHGEVHSLLAQIYLRRGDAARARQETRLAESGTSQTRPRDPTFEAMEAEAVSSRAHTARGVRLAREGSFAEAESAFRRVLEIRPGNVRDHTNLGGALFGLGRPAEALEQFDRAVELAPDDIEALNGRGLVLTALGRRDEAAASLTTALSIDPNASGPRINLGRLLFDEGRTEEAIAHYTEALRDDPGNGGAHGDLAVALARLGRLEQAVPHWEQALELDRFDLTARLSLSLARSRLGEHAAAIRLLREGLTLAPNSSRFVSVLAWELATSPDSADRNGAEALLLARRLFAVKGNSPETADVLAAALAETGDFAEAARVARLGVELAAAGDLSGIGEGLRQRLRYYESGRPFRQH